MTVENRRNKPYKNEKSPFRGFYGLLKIRELAESSWSRTNPRVANTLHQV